MRNRFILWLTAALLGSTGLYTLDPVARATAPQNLVSVLPSADMPIELSPATLLARQNGSAVVMLKARNTGTMNITNLVLIAFVYDSFGTSKGFYSASTHRTIDPGATETISVVTQDVGVSDGDHIIIAPLSTSTAGASWEANSAALLATAARAARGEPVNGLASALGAGMQGGGCGSGFCQTNHQLCKMDCEGKGGIKQWSCNLTECSFTCICST